MEKKKKNKIIALVIVIIIAIVAIVIASYAYWLITRKQADSNDLITACLNFDMQSTGEAINLESAWPISNEEGLNLEGYTFTVTNNCEQAVNYAISLESLTSTNTNYLDYKYVKLSLDNSIPIAYSDLSLIDNTVLDGDSETLRETREITNATVEYGKPNIHNIKLWLSNETPITEQNKSFRSRVRITGGQNVEGGAATILATADISRTKECSIQGSVPQEVCNPVTGNDVKYNLYNNGDIIISGTGDPKRYLNAGEALYYEIILNYMNTHNFTTEEINAFSTDEGISGLVLICFGLNLADLSKLAEVTLNDYTEAIPLLDLPEASIPVATSIINKLKSAGFIGNTKNIIVADGINSLSENMFDGASANSIIIADTVTKIEEGALDGINIMKELKLPNNITALESGAIRNVLAPDVDLVIPNSVTTIDTYNFQYSTFKSIKFPENDTYNSVSFSQDMVLERAYIPTSVTSLDGNLEAISNITLYMYGPERTLSGVSVSSFKQVVWNYTD